MVQGKSNGVNGRKRAFYSGREKPGVLRPAVNLPAVLPAELTAGARWVLWRLELVKNEWGKVPYRVDGKRASTTTPADWRPFAEVWDAYRQSAGGYDGVGRCLAAEDGLVGIDLDDVVGEGGELLPWAVDLIDRAGAYCDLSPSQTGMKLWVRGRWTPPAAGPKHRFPYRGGEVEVYAAKRYFTVTGHSPDDPPRPIADGAGLLAWLREELPRGGAPNPGDEDLDRFGGPGQSATRYDPSKPLPDCTEDEILTAALSSAAGDKIRRLLQGDLDGKPSHSEAESSLCWELAFWCGPGNAGKLRVYTIVTGHGKRRTKWDENKDYLKRTIDGVYDARAAKGAPFHRDYPQPEPPPPPVSVPGTAAPPRALKTPWPERLEPEAYHGVAGEFLRVVDPHTEADPAALLGQFLAAVGNVVGRGPYFLVEGNRHHCNEFVAVVGNTAKGRKGTSWGQVSAALGGMDYRWLKERYVGGGLSSGEGIKWNVRDPVYKIGKDGEEHLVEEGVTDKRLFVVESEFGGVLKAVERQGNTLSACMRVAWDGDTLRSLTKNDAITASDPHISVVAHTTADELLRLLSQTEVANGLGNRFVWLCSRRSKLLPEGGQVPEQQMFPIKECLAAVMVQALTHGLMVRDERARALWHEVYPKLSADRPGMAGALLARAEAHVLRLSMIYAVLDGLAVIGEAHLRAALAVWDYAEQSVRHIFGEALGDKLADEILRQLRLDGHGLTRTEISNHFQRNAHAAELSKALELLQRQGLVQQAKEATGGRPVDRWTATGG